MQEILIEDGRTTVVRVETKPAGMVGFRLRSESPPAGGTWKKLKIRSEPDGVEVPFHVYDAVQPFHVYDAAQPIQSGGIPRSGPLVLGKTAFPPGKHGFVITARGYRAARCQVEVVADRHVTVDVELFPH